MRPVLNTIAFGGVPTGIMNAQDADRAAHHQDELQLFLHALGHGFDLLLHRQMEAVDHGNRLRLVEILVKICKILGDKSS